MHIFFAEDFFLSRADITMKEFSAFLDMRCKIWALKQLLKIPDYLKNVLPVFPEHRVPHS